MMIEYSRSLSFSFASSKELLCFLCGV
jgi:hypothetical protein